MSGWGDLLVDLAVISMLVIGIGRFRTPRGARFGNHAAALALGAAIFLVLYRNGVTDPWLVGLCSVAGAVAGAVVAFRIDMTGIPAMVALQHGMGGVAAFLVSSVELVRGAGELGAVGRASGLLGLVIGAGTFSASMLAAGKLGNRLKQAPVRLPHHNAILVSLGVLMLGIAGTVWNADAGAAVRGIAVLIVLAAGFGVLFAIRIGGADMPVLISFLNATAGLAAAFCGIVIQNRLLIACGATVASSGSILTHVMCKAMNRSLANIFLGATGAASPSLVPVSSQAPDPGPSARANDPASATGLAKNVEP